MFSLSVTEEDDSGTTLKNLNSDALDDSGTCINIDTNRGTLNLIWDYYYLYNVDEPLNRRESPFSKR